MSHTQNRLKANVNITQVRSAAHHPLLVLAYSIHRVTVTYLRSISMPAGFRRHLVGKTLKNAGYYNSAKMRFIGKLMIVWTLS